MIGPGLMLVYLATGFLTVFTALNYAELASSIPKQGGGYTFTHDTIGGFPAFLTGWGLFVGSIVACALYALAVAHTLAVFIPGSTLQTVGIVAIIFICITLVTNIISVKGVTNVLGILNIAQSVVLFSFIAIGLFSIDASNLDPLYIPGSGVTSFMATVAFVYISFIGYELITTASEEIKEPARNIPRAILLTLLIATLVYFAASLVIVGVQPYTFVEDSAIPIAAIYDVMLGKMAFYFGLAGMAASNYAALNATFLASARVAFSMGRDRFFPGVLEVVNRKTRTPIPALILTFVLVSSFALSGDVTLVAPLSAFGYLIGQTIVNASVIVLRRKGLSVPGTFKTRFYPLVPILGIIVCIAFILSMDMVTLQLGGLLCIMGFITYMFYGRSYSKTKRGLHPEYLWYELPDWLEELANSRKLPSHGICQDVT
jgi:amino acid transporter